jgi:hypothetical protein
MDTITLTIVLLGVSTVVLSAVAAIVFFRTHPKHSVSKLLARALGWQLVGELIIGLGTLVFSVATWAGWLPVWPEYIKSGIRFAMFFATSSTTWHLLRTIKRIS